MKKSVFSRKIDELGRLVLPLEIRRRYSIAEKDEIEIMDEGDCILLKKLREGCMFCNHQSDLQLFAGRHICKSCIGAIARLSV